MQNLHARLPNSNNDNNKLVPKLKIPELTIKKHLNLLKQTKYFDIYKTLTEEIIKSKNEL